MTSSFFLVFRDAGTPNVKVGVVGAGTASVFEEVLQSSKTSLSLAFVPSKGSHVMLLHYSRQSSKSVQIVVLPLMLPSVSQKTKKKHHDIKNTIILKLLQMKVH